MKYYINDENEIISSEAFIDCGNEMRNRLNKEYRELTLEEMVKMTDDAPAWNCFEPEWYECMAEEAGLDLDDYNEIEEFIEDIMMNI